MSRADSIYQQVRSHLAYLNLAAAAEALPAELDHARDAKTTHTEFPSGSSRLRSMPPRLAATRAGCGSRTFPPPGGLRTSTSKRNHRSTRP